jgi:hypothetical protein
MLDPFWTITTFDAADEVARLRPPNDEADEVAVHASTEHRAIAAAMMRSRDEEEYIVYILFVWDRSFGNYETLLFWLLK